MSGIIGSKLNIRGSGRIAKLGTDGQVLTSSGAGVSAVYEDAAGGGLDWQSVTTGSTLTAVAGNGYPINTTSNACAITLPASASVGDQIMFTDYAGTWGTNSITFDINGLKYQGQDDTYTLEYDTDDQVLRIVYIDTTEGWMPIFDQAVTDDVPSPPLGDSCNDEGIIFGGSGPGASRDTSNKISNLGVVASDVTGVGTARHYFQGCEYGEDKGIFGGGFVDGNPSSYTGITNLVGSDGVIASDTAAVMTARRSFMAATYGGDKGIFYGGRVIGGTDHYDIKNLVSNVGVVASDATAASASGKREGAACEFDAAKNKDTAIMAYGRTDAAAPASTSNLISNLGVISADVTSISGTARTESSACSYGGDSGIIGYGTGPINTTNLITNTGVVGADVTGVGTARLSSTACEWGYTKGIFCMGDAGSGYLGMTNLVSDTGVVATDVDAVGTARSYPAGCSFN